MTGLPIPDLVLEAWDNLSAAVDRMVTALPAQLSLAAETLEEQRRAFRTTLMKAATPSRKPWPAPKNRPTGAVYDLPLDSIEIAIGDKLDRATLMDGHYDFEVGCYRRHILFETIRYYRQVWNARGCANDNYQGRRLHPGFKKVIRRVMHLIDNAYEVEVSGVFLVTSQNEDHMANQCYVGGGGAGWSGSKVEATLLFRGQMEPGEGEDRVNQEAINITKVRWPQHKIVDAKAAFEAAMNASVDRR